MVQKIVEIDSVKCFIVLTNTAREAIKQHFTDEHAFFKLQQSFYVYIEKQAIEESSISLSIFFDNKRNNILSKKFSNRVVIMDCIFDIKNGLVAKSFRTRGPSTPVETNRRKPIRIHFVASRINGHTYPKEFIQLLADLPVAQERFDYVNKRITSWEGYLKVLNKNADIEDIDATFNSLQVSNDFSTINLRLSNIEDKQWGQLKGLSVYVKGYNREIGEVVKVQRSNRQVEIQLSPKISKLLQKDEFDFTSEFITFSNASTKSQLNRLLKGFERLKEGLAANANLENILFEDQLKVIEPKKDLSIEFHNNLNEYQRDAVAGAISAEDLYVIQGPPGTGKTTVISEICYQNSKAGLKTLIASQSNLAVDNALGRLLSNKDIRILRYGRTESIEEEGKKFIEENVADYWKAQTLQAVTNEISQHKTKENELQEEISKCENEIEHLKAQEETLHLAIEKKNKAKIELEKITEEISSLKKKIIPLKKEREKTELALEKLSETKDKITTRINELNEQLALLGKVDSIEGQIKEAHTQIEKYKQQINYQKLQFQLNEYEHELNTISMKITDLEPSSSSLIEKVNEVESIKKLYDIEQYIETHKIRRGYVLNQLFSDMEKIHQHLLNYQSLKDVSNRFNKAVEYCQNTLGIQFQLEAAPINHQYSLQEINEFLTELSYAFAKKKVNQENGNRLMKELYVRKISLNHLTEKYNALIEESKIVFTKIKEEVIDQITDQTGNNQSQLASLKERQSNFTLLLNRTKEQLTQFEFNESEIELETDPNAAIRELESNIEQLKDNMEKTAQIQSKLDLKKEEEEQVNSQIQTGQNALNEMIEELKQLNATGIQLEKQFAEVEQITKQNPEAELEKTQKKSNELKKEIEVLKEKIGLLPIAEVLHKEWKSLLEHSTEHDLEEIRKLYVKHANVIGTTCVASANKEFMDNYPIFDVVIIDEVSKATPPELLLPMLKGKKIILVGDHHQLPPLIGDETFEETLEEVIKDSNTFEQKRELEKLLEESLFERLYKNLPRTNKKMLAIQYRMHENIMQSIAPFYENESDSLKCGLTNSDEMRDHKLESQFIKRNDHLLWFDVPNEHAYFEQRMKEGSSLFNEAELKIIHRLLTDLDDSVKLAKENGLIEKEALKSVGVISFYAEQVRRINRLIEECNLQHIHIRTGSVDKFQGMEMDVILVSMVRNNDNKHGDIGFAKDYRRLNVALSRARELLMLIGSTDMFTARPKKKETQWMYQNLLNTVKNQNGYRYYINN
ncbi:DNA helicase [Ureibacillus massiliensis 4400831 = CIP 108448 = CCUG 49529]|uniref:DNA helicase n=2 Tax=cellular organisms TaxID=131567 RepID=A0A0A3JTJ8_9BACL|nr:AAA domain-containing protein [Ureibacillus massiliensis]KGR90302.1 DNA helicase [Ureibacillus massiliensis 4400831 = CIP 108448 = CCUG 49529]